MAAADKAKRHAAGWSAPCGASIRRPGARWTSRRRWNCWWRRSSRPNAPTSGSTWSRRRCFAKYPTCGRFRRRAAGRIGKGHAKHRLLPQQGQKHPGRLPRAGRAIRRPGARQDRTTGQLPGVGRKTANVILGTAFGVASGDRGGYPRGPGEPAAGADAAKGPGEDRAGPHGGGSATRVDRLQPPHDPARPPLLPGAKPRVRGLPAAARSAPRIGVDGPRGSAKE